MASFVVPMERGPMTPNVPRVSSQDIYVLAADVIGVSNLD
jgi:hypothetical protein